MNDRSSEQMNYSELKFSRKHSFFNENIHFRWPIALLFALAIFGIMHFRETAVEMLEVNTTAPGYIVSQADFNFYDDEATIILKQEAVRDVGKIYKLDDNEIRQRRIEYENELMAQQNWLQSQDSSDFQELYRLGELFEKALDEMRFTDPRTLQKLREVQIPNLEYQIYTPLSLNEAATLPHHIWESLQSKLLPPATFSVEKIDYVIGWFQSKQWKLQEDIPAVALLSKKLKNRIADKYTFVAAGSRIIDQGDRVTPRHIAMMQAMQKKLQDNRNLWHPLTLVGSIIMTLLLISISTAYLHINHPKLLASNRSLLLLLTITLLTFALAKGTEYILLTYFNSLIDIVRYPIFVPFAAILLYNLMNPAIATFISGLLVIILTMALTFERQGFMFVNLVASLVAILSSRSLKQRNDIFVVCGKTWLATVLALVALSFYQNSQWSMHIVTDAITAAINMLLIAVLIVGLLPLLESTFNVMTDVSLMEYMNPNSTLVRRLSIEAPGTHQHSMIVGNLAEAAALAIGANGLFCRVATLYHDIGKIIAPHYFTENQSGGENPHMQLTPRESARIILGHVTEGVILANKAALPEQFIDIIKEHHGTTLAYYFYRKELERVGNDKSLVNEADFRYEGPRPRSKESAIVMLADSLEAASRSLDVINEETLSQLAARLTKDKAEDGQLDNCLLTFEELSIVKSALVKTLLAYGHSRVKYPSRETSDGET
jgi:hypothetical protein